MAVRLATLDDIAALQALDRWPKETMWRHKIAGREVVVLEIGEEVVGLARYDVLWTTVPFLGLIAIAEDFRGHGHSREMIDFLADHLRAEGYVALLSSSQTDEPAAQAWHLHLGFTSNGIIENIAEEGIGEVVYRMML